MPGQIALQRMPWVTKSAATLLVKPITAAFDAPYTKRLGTPLRLEDTDDMFTIEPPPAASMPGRKARNIEYMLFTFRLKEKSQACSSHSKIVP